jgi:hypothetical protein
VSDLTLITNVQGVTMPDGIQLHAHAVLVQPPDPECAIGEPRAKVRGFGVDGGLPTFTKRLDEWDAAAEIVLEPCDVGGALFIGADGVAKPLFSGALLKVGGLEMFLQIEDDSRPFHLDTFTADEYERLWRTLAYRVAEFWDAPNMPQPKWYPAEWLRSVYRQKPGVLPAVTA